jgi:hypothetical protein
MGIGKLLGACSRVSFSAPLPHDVAANPDVHHPAPTSPWRSQPPGVTNSSSIISIYQSAIPKAKQVGATGPLANAFASALYEVVGVQGGQHTLVPKGFPWAAGATPLGDAAHAIRSTPQQQCATARPGPARLRALPPPSHAPASRPRPPNSFFRRAGDASALLGDMLAAVAGTIRVGGCRAAQEFTEGVYTRLVDHDPSVKGQIKNAFQSYPLIARCKYSFP